MPDNDRLRRFLIRQLGPTDLPDTQPGKAPPRWDEAIQGPSDAELVDALERRVHLLRGSLMDTGPTDARRVTKQLFLGNGLRSLHGVRVLHDRLSHAVSLLSGLQQGGPDDPEDVARTEECIRDVVQDIALALTGQEVTFRPER